MSRTKIQAVEFFETQAPLAGPIGDATHRLLAVNFIVARITLADGTTGEGYLLAFHFSPAAIRGALADVRALAVGRDVWETRAFNAACDNAFEYFGATGLLRWARGVVNLAMWDAWGRHLGKPIWQLLGANVCSVHAYGSGGWVTYSIEQLVAEATAYVRRGFAAIKLKVGSLGTDRDVERIAKVREAVGPGVRIMIDANRLRAAGPPQPEWLSKVPGRPKAVSPHLVSRKEVVLEEGEHLRK